MRKSSILIAAGAFVMSIGVIPVSAAGEGGSGTVVGWGLADPASPPAGLTDVVAVEAGGSHSLALRSDGTVVGWGENGWGEIDVPAGLSDVVAISGGGSHSLALKSDGTVVAWGSNRWGEIDVPAGLSDVVVIDGAYRHSLALKSDGTVVAWGINNAGQIDVPAGLSDAVAVEGGESHSLALKSDGTVVAWGWNGYGQTDVPAGLTDVVAVDTGVHHNLALKSDGTVVAWGLNWDPLGGRCLQGGQTDVPAGLTDVVAVAAGYWHSLALQADGTVVGWGDNCNPYDPPYWWWQATPPMGLTDVVAIDAGAWHSLALVVQNESPVSDPGGPYLGAVGDEIAFDGSGSSDPDGDPLNYDWEWGDTTTSSDAGATATHTYGATGIYDVCLTVTDPSGEWDAACTYAVVYDPAGGFVTGGGWFDSPDGAYEPDPSLTGRATFGFVSRYKKGAEIPTGNTEFQFHAAELNFHSDAYEWLVVTGDDRAMFKGVGTINGTGEYKFKLWAGDDEPDTFRFKIWTEDEFGVETVVYDNGMDQAIAGGGIIIHVKK